MTTFFLVRHASCARLGETLWGRADGVCLNETGKAEAQQLAQRFRGVKLKAVYSSPLERALETAEAIARVARFEVQRNPAFNEIDFGDWTGTSFAQLADDLRWQQFNTQRSMVKVPGGEWFLEVQARVVTELDRLSQEDHDAKIAIVSHADVIKAAVGYVAGTPIDLLQRFEISPCSVSVLALNKQDVRLLAVNSKCELS